MVIWVDLPMNSMVMFKSELLAYQRVQGTATGDGSCSHVFLNNESWQLEGTEMFKAENWMMQECKKKNSKDRKVDFDPILDSDFTVLSLLGLLYGWNVCDCCKIPWFPIQICTLKLWMKIWLQQFHPRNSMILAHLWLEAAHIWVNAGFWRSCKPNSSYAQHFGEIPMTMGTPTKLVSECLEQVLEHVLFFQYLGNSWFFLEIVSSQYIEKTPNL